MLTSSIASLAFAFIAVVSPAPSARPASPPYMTPPAGWTSVGPPPPDSGFDYLWVSPHFHDGSPHAGDSMGATVRVIPLNSTLADQVRETTIDETQDGRIVASSQSHTTCNGTQPGWTIDFRLPIMPPLTISQIWHFAVWKGHVYAINFTHTAGLAVNPEVQASIDSLCPEK
jgi:hypothetical protein